MSARIFARTSALLPHFLTIPFILDLLFTMSIHLAGLTHYVSTMYLQLLRAADFHQRLLCFLLVQLFHNRELLVRLRRPSQLAV